jgi:hypothetical protein
MTNARIPLVLVALWSALLGCGHSPNADLSRLDALWHSGNHRAAAAEAEAMIRRTAEANGVSLEELRERATTIRARLSSEPVPPGDAGRPDGNDRFPMRSDQLDSELQTALLHPDALVTIRAAITVGELQLKRHAKGLLSLITRPGPVRLERTYPSIDTPLMAWLTAKLVAQESLHQLVAR